MFELEDALVAVLNQSQIPLDAKYYVVQSILHKISDAYKVEAEKLKQESQNQEIDGHSA